MKLKRDRWSLKLKRRMEIETEERQMEIEAEERRMKIEAEERRMKIQAKERMKAEVEKMKKEADKEIKLAWITAQGRPAQVCPEDAMSRLHLPQYKDRKVIATYLTHFERV